MSEYKILQISTQKPPRNWKTRRGDGYVAYKMLFEGIEEPVEASVADDRIPKTGETITGDIKPGEFGNNLVEWRPKKTFQGRDDASIKAQFAIKAAIAWTPKDAGLGTVETVAKELYNMVDRIKSQEAKSPIDKVFPETQPITIPDDF